LTVYYVFKFVFIKLLHFKSVAKRRHAGHTVAEHIKTLQLDSISVLTIEIIRLLIAVSYVQGLWWCLYFSYDGLLFNRATLC